MSEQDKSITASIHETFATRWGFLFAAMGSAVGLGNIWRFPFIAGENGGGAFVLLYLFFILIFGVPAMIAMVMIGRRGRQSPIGSFRTVAVNEGRSRNWQYLGWLAVLAGYIGLTYFSVVAGWSMDYLLMSIRGFFTDITADQSEALFDSIKANPLRMTFWHAVFMGITIFIGAKGVRRGVEKSVKIMMPALFILLIGLVVYSAFTANFGAALSFLFTPDFSRLTGESALLALGQAFFSLSVGGGGVIVYGAYLSKEASIPRSIGVVATADTAAALLAAMAIFPIVITYGLEAAGGPGLIFQALPVAFAKMPGGYLFGTMFFLLILFAALSTSISMLESVVSYVEEKKGWSRPVMAFVVGGVAWVVGLITVFSYNIWNGLAVWDYVPIRHLIDNYENAPFFRIMDFLISNIALPVSAFLIAIFAGWIMTRKSTMEELGQTRNSALFIAWRFIMRYLMPLAVGAIFAFNIYNIAVR